jgi:hypothetical protein
MCIGHLAHEHCLLGGGMYPGYQKQQSEPNAPHKRRVNRQFMQLVQYSIFFYKNTTAQIE